MKRDAFAAAAALVLLMSVPASAEVEFTNDITFFDVQGKTAAELYESILAHSMKIGGKRTVASISTRLTQSGRARETDNSCKADEYRIKLSFVVSRPQLPDESALSPADRQHWDQMSIFIRSHEELHRQIWLGCAQALSDEVAAIEEESCSNVTKKTNDLWTKMLVDCDLKQKSFDDQQTRLLFQQPFYLDAMRNRPTQ